MTRRQPISTPSPYTPLFRSQPDAGQDRAPSPGARRRRPPAADGRGRRDRKSTRLNSTHTYILRISFFFSNDTPTTDIYPLSLHAPLPFSARRRSRPRSISWGTTSAASGCRWSRPTRSEEHTSELHSHLYTSYFVFFF